MSRCAVVVTFSLTNYIVTTRNFSTWSLAVTRDIVSRKASSFFTFLPRMWKDFITSYPSVNIVKSSSLASNGSFVYKHCRLRTSFNQGSENKMLANSWD